MTATRRYRCPICTLNHRSGFARRCDTIDRTWPLEPLLEAMGSPTTKGASEILGLEEQAISRARANGLSDQLADRWAIRAGLHPAYVWPDWIDAALTWADRRFLASGWRQAWLHADTA